MAVRWFWRRLGVEGRDFVITEKEPRKRDAFLFTFVITKVVWKILMTGVGVVFFGCMICTAGRCFVGCSGRVCPGCFCWDQTAAVGSTSLYFSPIAVFGFLSATAV